MPLLTLEQYQIQARKTSKQTLIGNDPLIYPLLGLSGEVGEMLNKAKKIYRDNGGRISSDTMAKLVDELGDILWYVAEICTVLKQDLELIAAFNLDKLSGRYSTNGSSGVVGTPSVDSTSDVNDTSGTNGTTRLYKKI